MFFGVLGPVAVWTAGGEPVPVPGLKVRALLAVLLVQEGRPVSSARLLEALWGERLPGDPVGTLSGKATQLRRALERAEPGGRSLVGSPPPGYRLRLEDGAVDAARFRALVARGRETADARARAGLLREALALWRGPAYADFADEPFVRIAAARLAEERLAALEDLAEARLALGEHTELVAELAGPVAANPTRERLRAVHIRALYQAGRPAEALDSFDDLRTRLADELGLDPGPELVEMQRAMLGREPAPAAPLHVARPRTNLPATLTEMIGREEEQAAVRKALESGRLVTLTGTGGVGKTRLAVEVASGLLDHVDCPDGVWMAELGALEPGSGVGPAEVVRAALDVRDVAGAGDRLVEALAGRRLLLVLDNCEHVIEAAAALAGRLLRGCPRLRVLATSREALGLPGEVVCAVPPLEVPAADADPAHVARSPAVRLFLARAAAAAPGFALDAGNAGAVAELCRRLDGVPLALELAATRVRALGVAELVARLHDRFRLLATGRRDAPGRQQTLTAMIEWSWELLSDPERAVLRRLSVHADGCTLEAAEAVCGGPDPTGPTAPDVAVCLSRLVDRSLVTVSHGPDGPRYRLLESVGVYGADRLAAAGEAGRTRDRHGRYYTALAERAEPYLYGAEQRGWLRRLDVEAADLRSALDHAVRAGAADRALRLVCALAWYWFLNGRLAEARRSLHAALTTATGTDPAALARARAWLAGIEILLTGHTDPAATTLCEQLADPAERARAEWFMAYAEIDLGDVTAVDRRLERALAGFAATGDRWGTAAALSTRAKLAFLRADQRALERDGERSAELFRELGDRWGVVQATGWLAGLAEMVCDHARASSLYREGLRMAEELGLWPQVATGLAGLGWIAVQQCDYAQARELSGQGLRLAAEQGFRVGEIFAEIGVAFAARRSGNLDLAERHLAALLRAAGPDDDQPPALHKALVLNELGYLAAERGHAAAARRLHLRAMRAARTLGAARDIAMTLEGLAGAAALADDHETSARLLGAADSARRAAHLPAAPSEQREIDRIAAAARPALGGDAFDKAYLDGTTQPPGDIVDAAFGEVASHPR